MWGSWLGFWLGSWLLFCHVHQHPFPVLKLFVVPIKAGYERSMLLDELAQRVGDCPVRSAGRELTIEEVGLRRKWMGVVYGLLDMLDNGGGGEGRVGGGGEGPADRGRRTSTAIRTALSAHDGAFDSEARSGGELDAVLSSEG